MRERHIFPSTAIEFGRFDWWVLIDNMRTIYFPVPMRNHNRALEAFSGYGNDSLITVEWCSYMGAEITILEIIISAKTLLALCEGMLMKTNLWAHLHCNSIAMNNIIQYIRNPKIRRQSSLLELFQTGLEPSQTSMLVSSTCNHYFLVPDIKLSKSTELV